MTPYLSSLSKSNHVTSSPMIQTVDGSTMHVCHIGTISIPSLSILNVFHVPQLSMNLLSIGHLCKLGFHVCFPPLVMMCRILKRGKLLGNVIELEKCSSFHPFIFLNRIGKMFKLSSLHLPQRALSSTTPCSSPPSSLQL